MKKEKFLSDQKTILLIISTLIIFLLFIIGFSLPKGIYGIKPLKTVTFIATQESSLVLENKSDKMQSKLYTIFIIILSISVIIYLILNPSKLLSYLLAFLILVGIFFFINFLLKLSPDQQPQYSESKTPEAEPFNFFEKLNIQPYEEESSIEPIKQKDSSYKTLYIIIVFILVFISSLALILFIFSLVKRIIKEFKESGFSLFYFKNRHKKELVSDVKKAMNEAISLLDNNKDMKSAIINCYIALIYAVKKYTKKVKEPSMTSREFEPILISLGLESSDIDLITSAFEKAKYSKEDLSLEEKNDVNKSLKNCILKLKKMATNI